MVSIRKFTRREFIRLTTLVSAGAAVAACTTPTTAPTVAPSAAPAATKAPEPTKAADATKPPAATTAPKSAYTEAPMLADLVKAGKLPPVDQRLPEKPMVMTGIESQVGNHGGSIRRAYKGVSDRWGPTKMIDRSVVWFDAKLNLVPRLCESWQLNSTATEFTFILRKGAKWSDGKPFTSADVKWWFDNFLNNKLLTPAIGSPWVTGAKKTLVKLDVPDATTVKFTFADPNPLFPFQIVRNLFFMPGHYLKQFHNDLTDDKAALEKAAKAAGFASWDLYFIDRNNWFANTALPIMGAWVAKNELGKDIFLMERNPYFFAVDSKGNQLPYLDTIKHRVFQDLANFELWITNGEIDFQSRHTVASSYTLMKKSETSGDYKLVLGSSAWAILVQLNLGCKNKKLREFFNDRNARIALNLALDRDKINELVYNGLYTTSQYAPIKASPQYYEKASKAYTTFDVAKANKLLDDAGYTKKNAEGIRLYKDSSEPITFLFDGFNQYGSSDVDCGGQITKMWQAIGIKASYKLMERSLYEQRQLANDHEAGFIGDARSILPLVGAAIGWRGVATDRLWAGAYGLWKNNPAAQGAEEPPKDHFLVKIWNLWDQIVIEPDSAKRDKLFFQILDIHAEEAPMVGLFMELPQIAVVKNGFKNFIKGWPYDDTTGDEQVYNSEMYYWDDPKKHV